MRVLILFLSVLVFANAQLPKRVQADMYLLKAKKSMESDDYKSAMQSFRKILDLGVSVPNSFHYFYAKSLYKSQKAKEAKKELDIFLSNGGDKSKHYVKALELYSNLEEAVKKEERELAKKKEQEAKLQKRFETLAREYKSKKRIITSKITGLMWSTPMANKYRNNPLIKERPYDLTIKEAAKYCANLTLGGFDDWRLPQLKDFTTIARDNARRELDWKKYEVGGNHLFWVKGDSRFRLDPFDKKSRRFSERYYYLVDYTLSYERKRRGDAICVRVNDINRYRNYFKHKYVILNIGNHKLMMEDSFMIANNPYVYDVEVSYGNAISYCKKLKLAGFDDWRVPTKEDMLKHIPCRIDKVAYFIYGQPQSIELLYGNTGIFSSKLGVMIPSKCKIYRKRSNYRALIRCVRDVDKPKQTTSSSNSDSFEVLNDGSR